MKLHLLAFTLFAGATALATPTLGKTLKWSSQGDIVTMDPYAHTESFTSNMQHHIYDPLVRRNKQLEIEPALATSWTIVEPNRWRFKIRQGVKFHNGDVLSADDVVASITRLLDPTSRAKGNLPAVEKAEKVDDQTVDLVLKGPYPLLLNDLSGIFIMSKKWMEANNALKPGNTTTGVTTFASTNANGTGPFKLESYKPDVGTTLVVNPDWWDKPQHNLTRIEFKPIKSDATRVAALLSGEIDMMAPAPLQDLQRMSGAGMKVVEEPSLRVIFLGVNMRPELLAMPGQKNPMLDKRVRQAMWQAIDLDTIQKRVMRGKSRNIGLMVAPPVPGYDASLDVLPKYDPDAAKKLLADAGYPNGFKTKLDCPNDRYIADEQICVAIAAMWKKVGIDVDLKTESRATYFPRQDKGETDAYMLGWATLPPMDSYSVLSAIFATRKQGTAFGGNNPNGLSDPRFDDLATKAGVELDEKKRRAMLTEALKIAKDEVYFLPLHQQPVAWAMKTNVELPQFPDEYVRLWFAKVN